MSERSTDPATTGSGHWGSVLNEAELSEYEPLRGVETQQAMKQQAGRKVSFGGSVYINEARPQGHLLALVAEEVSHSWPVLVQTANEIRDLPQAARVRVWGRMADEPYANAG